MNFNLAALPADLRDLFNYWSSKRQGARLPARADLDPLEIPHHLSRLCLIDVLPRNGGTGYRYRLVGTEVVSRMARDYTGYGFDEILDRERLAPVLAVYGEVVESALPNFGRDAMPLNGKKNISYERLLLPLAEDGQRVDMLLAGFAFESR